MTGRKPLPGLSRYALRAVLAVLICVVCGILANAAHFGLANLDPALDVRPQLSAAFRAGELGIDSDRSWRNGPRRAIDCAYWQATLPDYLAPIADRMAVRNFSDPRGLADSCEVLRNLAVGDPIAQQTERRDTTPIAAGREAMTWALQHSSLPVLRLGIVALWLLAGALASLAAMRDPGASGRSDPATAAMPLLLAGFAALFIGPSPSVAFSLTLLIACCGWLCAVDGTRLLSLPSVAILALGAALIAVTEYRAPIGVAGLAMVATLILARSPAGLRAGAAVRHCLAGAAIFGLASFAARVIHDLGLQRLSEGSLAGFADTILDRLAFSADPLIWQIVPATALDAVDDMLPGTRILAFAAWWAIGFGLIYGAALWYAARRERTPLRVAFAALLGLAPILLWIVLFGGRSALGAAEGGVFYAWLASAASLPVVGWILGEFSRGHDRAAAPSTV